MKKYLITLFLIVALQFVGAKGFFNYPLSDTDKELYFTNETSLNSTSVIAGRYQNLDISPNYFDTIGYSKNIESYKEYKPGFFHFHYDSNFMLMKPSVTLFDFDYFSNYSGRFNLKYSYEFKIKMPLEKLSLSAGPNAKIDFNIGYFSNIDNIMIQTLLSSTLGLSVTLGYNLLETLRFGIDFSTFIVGFNLGTNGYNKEYVPNFNVINYGNYTDFITNIYAEYDISRTESLRIGYGHSVFTSNSENNTLSIGEHRFSLGFNKKLVR